MSITGHWNPRNICFIHSLNELFRALAFIGLFLIAFGTGGIKPCVASFGGEQFKLPEQQEAMSTYFSLFYAAINSGSLISTILTPLLRQKVSCANEDTWWVMNLFANEINLKFIFSFFILFFSFPAAFGVPAALMVVSIGKILKLIWIYRLHPIFKLILTAFIHFISLTLKSREFLNYRTGHWTSQRKKSLDDRWSCFGVNLMDKNWCDICIFNMLVEFEFCHIYIFKDEYIKLSS